MGDAPRVLTLDIETSPNLADVWGLWDQNVGLPQLRAVSQVIGVGAKWLGSSKRVFLSDFHNGHEEMVKEAHALLDEADVVVHYNGKKFDIPHLRREFLLAGMTPPSSVQEVDLMAAVKSQFRFVSYKLDHVVQQLGLGAKVKHEGHELWVACMAGDPKAWARMRRYCLGDVDITEKLYGRVRPWIPSHPHMGLYLEKSEACRNCGGVDLQRRGYRYADTGRYARLRCNSCGAWSRATVRDFGVKAR